MEGERMKAKANKIAWYVKTTKKNYFINLIITTIFTLILGRLFITIRTDLSHIPAFLIIFTIFVFILIYRIIEYLLTHKTVSSSSSVFFLFGRELSGKYAKFSFWIDLIFLLIILIIGFYV